SGTLRFDIRRPAGGKSNYTFATPTSQIAVRGTVGLLSLDPAGQTTVACLTCAQGDVDVTTTVGTPQTYHLVTGQSLTITAAGIVTVAAITAALTGAFAGAGVSTSASSGAAAASAGVGGASAGAAAGAAAGTTTAVAAGAAAAATGVAAVAASNKSTSAPSTPTPIPTISGNINLQVHNKK
ncbi:MAG: hypothetical protein JO347_10265, partial [Candidatus Eremiobacteraeota bacterium]|nr:hypothetical protein [Candidatus Eremiobacteraeota bacterium]